jgi:L-threonylcarbamoyladenylate synthase
MHTIPEDDSGSINKALAVLKSGGVIVYPTDTAYGLGVDATNEQAVEKIFAIKDREYGKPVPVIVGDIDAARRIATFSASAEKLASAFWPGALTIVVPAREHELSQSIHGETTIGIRIPKQTWCVHLAQSLGAPITSTSANATETPAQYSIEGVRHSLGATAALVDLWIDGGILSGGPVSTVVVVAGDQIDIKREGAISRENIEKVLG